MPVELSNAAKRRQRRAKASSARNVGRNIPVAANSERSGAILFWSGSRVSFDSSASTRISRPESGGEDASRGDCPLVFGEDAAACGDMVRRIERADVSERDAFALSLAPCARELALARFGCRVIQKAVEMTNGRAQAALAKALEPHVIELLDSPHGNHVLARMIEVMPSTAIGFVIEAMCGRVREVARHRFGCRIFERLIEHCGEDQIAGVLDEVVMQSEALCRHMFGNFVVQHIFEHSSLQRRNAVLQKMLPVLPMLVVHRTASHVVLRAFGHSDSDTKAMLIDALFKSVRPCSLVDIACSRYGSPFIEQLARERIRFEEIRGILVCGMPELLASKFGTRVAVAFQLDHEARSGI